MALFLLLLTFCTNQATTAAAPLASRETSPDRATSERTCRAWEHPRFLPSLLSASDAHELTTFFLKQAVRFHVEWRREEYPLLLELALKGAHADLIASVIRKVQAAVAASIGPGFVILDDFFSFRTGEVAFTPKMHQDLPFWHTEGCSAFLVWAMLSNEGLNTSFDIFERQHNERLYALARRSRTRSWYLGPPRLQPWRGKLRSTNIPLGSGDAIILRQPEVHSTDTTPLLPMQWRLAVGFRFVKVSPVSLELRTFNEPTQHDTSIWPCIFPPSRLGELPPDRYNVTSISRCSESAPALSSIRRPYLLDHRVYQFRQPYNGHFERAVRKVENRYNQLPAKEARSL